MQRTNAHQNMKKGADKTEEAIWTLLFDNVMPHLQPEESWRALSECSRAARTAVLERRRRLTFSFGADYRRLVLHQELEAGGPSMNSTIYMDLNSMWQPGEEMSELQRLLDLVGKSKIEELVLKGGWVPSATAQERFCYQGGLNYKSSASQTLQEALATVGRLATPKWRLQRLIIPNIYLLGDARLWASAPVFSQTLISVEIVVSVQFDFDSLAHYLPQLQVVKLDFGDHDSAAFSAALDAFSHPEYGLTRLITFAMSHTARGCLDEVDVAYMPTRPHAVLRRMEQALQALVQRNDTTLKHLLIGGLGISSNNLDSMAQSLQMHCGLRLEALELQVDRLKADLSCKWANAFRDQSGRLHLPCLKKLNLAYAGTACSLNSVRFTPAGCHVIGSTFPNLTHLNLTTEKDEWLDSDLAPLSYEDGLGDDETTALVTSLPHLEVLKLIFSCRMATTKALLAVLRNCRRLISLCTYQANLSMVRRSSDGKFPATILDHNSSLRNTSFSRALGMHGGCVLQWLLTSCRCLRSLALRCCRMNVAHMPTTNNIAAAINIQQAAVLAGADSEQVPIAQLEELILYHTGWGGVDQSLSSMRHGLEAALFERLRKLAIHVPYGCSLAGSELMVPSTLVHIAQRCARLTKLCVEVPAASQPLFTSNDLRSILDCCPELQHVRIALVHAQPSDLMSFVEIRGKRDPPHDQDVQRWPAALASNGMRSSCCARFLVG